MMIHGIVFDDTNESHLEDLESLDVLSIMVIVSVELDDELCKLL